MQSCHLCTQGDIDSLIFRRQYDLSPGRKQVVVRLRAAALNYRDLMILEGRYGGIPFMPDLIPLSDGAGEVIAVGPQTSRFKVGDKVIGVALPSWIAGEITADVMADQPGANKNGMLAEQRVFDENALVAMPEHLTFAQAAALPGAGVTAWTILQGLQAGQTVLTQGTGGVSTFALQFAKLMGARVIATTSDNAKAEKLKSLGADEVINYRETPDWHETVRKLTQGRGVDRVVDVGGLATLAQSIQSTRMRGQIELVGSLGGKNASFDPSVFAQNIITIRWASAGNRTDFEAMNRAISLHHMTPLMDRSFHFKEAKEAFHYFADRSHVGKVTINLG